jgi:lipopolysaccharide exporter
MVLSGSGARVVGILGTLAVTRYLHPEQYGEVSLAALIMLITTMLTSGGLSQYIAARPKAGRDVMFHATVFYLLFGTLGVAATLLFGDQIGAMVRAPGIVKYLPGLALASMLDRIATIQDRIQLRSMRFRSVGVQRTLGEMVYAGVSVGLAAFAADTPYGGANALVWGSLARGGLRVITLSITTPRADWLSPCKLDWKITREMLSFGVPMAVVTIASMGAQKFDNIVFQYHFGLAWLTFYNLAYNFADMPSALIGDQIGDVLVPSFAHMQDDEGRKQALLLAMRMMVLIVTPLAIGLALVAPTLSKLAFDRRYQEGIIKILQILAMFSMAKTITWVGTSYLQVRNQPRVIMKLEVGRMLGVLIVMNAFIFAGVAMYGRGHAVRWACWSVVFVFTVSAFSYMAAIRKLDGISLRDQIMPLLPPLLACVPMVLAVIAMRRVFTYLHMFMPHQTAVTIGAQMKLYAPRLILEVILGAIVFVPSALILAPRSSRELLRLVRDAIRRRRGGGAGEGEVPAAAGEP